MDGFNQGFPSPTSIKPDSPFQGLVVVEGNDEEGLSADKKPLMSAASAKKKRNENLGDEEQCCLSSLDSRLPRSPVVDHLNNSLLLQPPYDPINNYLSPRPRFLMYDPNRHRQIFARQETVTPSTEEDLESSSECSLGASHEEVVEEVDSAIGKDEDEYDEEEECDEDSGWSSNAFLQYLVVVIVLILTTLTISSPNHPTLSSAREAVRGFMDLYRAVGFNFSEVMLMVGKLSRIEVDYGYEEWDNKGLPSSTVAFAEMQDGRTKDAWEDEVEELVDQDEEEKCGWPKEGHDQLEGSETEEKEPATWGQKELLTAESKEVENKEIEDQDEISYQLQEPMILIGKEVETYEIEGSGGDDSYRTEGLENVKMMAEKDDVGKEESNNDGLYENKIEGIRTIDVLIKLASSDPSFAASMGVAVLILVSLSVLYYSKQKKFIEMTIAHKNSTDEKNLEPFTNSSHSTYIHGSYGMKGSIFAESNFSPPRWKKNESSSQTDAASSSQRRSFHLELSDEDTLLRGSFIVEKKIVKKQKNKQPEETLSAVRRSSRIHRRLVMSP